MRTVLFFVMFMYALGSNYRTCDIIFLLMIFMVFLNGLLNAILRQGYVIFQLAKDGRYQQIFGVCIVSFLADLSYETS